MLVTEDLRNLMPMDLKGLMNGTIRLIEPARLARERVSIARKYPGRNPQKDPFGRQRDDVASL
jgi:hypothetical protein